MFKQESLKKAEVWLALKGWQESYIAIPGKFWVDPLSGQHVPTIYAAGLQVLRDFWG